MPQGAHSLRRERAGAARAAVALLGELSALVLLLTSCDQGKQHDQPLSRETAPFLHIVGTNVATDKPLPVDGAIQIGFDRLLDPVTVTRQSFQLQNAFSKAIGNPTVDYDPVARVVTISNANNGWIEANQPYKVVIGIPSSEDDVAGPRAFDGATLDPAAGPVVLFFQAAAAPDGGAPSAPPEPTMDFCHDVMPIFRGKCSGGPCHHAPASGGAPPEGLVLETSDGVLHTAFDTTSGKTQPRVAHGANTGANTAVYPTKVGTPFGTNMALITPGDPADSWLMYKVLLGRARPIDQARDASAPPCFVKEPVDAVDPARLPMQPLSDDERTRLGAFIRGRQMPYPTNLPDNEPAALDDPSAFPLTFQELERVRLWIKQLKHGDDSTGFVIPQCTACERPRCPPSHCTDAPEAFAGCATASCVCDTDQPSDDADECHVVGPPTDAGQPSYPMCCY